jgi:ribosomal protein S4
MFSKLIKGQNLKKYKLHDQTKINITKNPYIIQKLKSKKWYFLRFQNKFCFFPRIGKMNKMRFFYKNSLNVRRVLKRKNCHINTSSLYKLYQKARRGNPTYLHFINLLESRLDVCLFRTGLFTSPISLRQFILHRNIYLNGTLVTKPGILLQKDDLVQINFIHLDYYNYDKIMGSSFDNFSHLEIDLKTCSFIYLGPFGFSDMIRQKYKDVSFLNYIFRF